MWAIFENSHRAFLKEIDSIFPYKIKHIAADIGESQPNDIFYGEVLGKYEYYQYVVDLFEYAKTGKIEFVHGHAAYDVIQNPDYYSYADNKLRIPFGDSKSTSKKQRTMVFATCSHEKTLHFTNGCYPTKKTHWTWLENYNREELKNQIIITIVKKIPIDTWSNFDNVDKEGYLVCQNDFINENFKSNKKIIEKYIKEAKVEHIDSLIERLSKVSKVLNLREPDTLYIRYGQGSRTARI